MTHLLAICLVLAAGADPADADRRSAGVADDDIAAATEKLFESLNRQIQETAKDPQQISQLAQMYATRGWLLLRKGELEKARSDFDTAIELDPQSPYAHSGRAEYFRRTGDLTRAEEEMRHVAFNTGARSNQGTFDGDRFNPFEFGLIPAVGAWIIVALCWVGATFINVAVGWRQKVEASGSMARLVWVAVWLASTAVLPLAAWGVSVSSTSAMKIQLPMAAGLTVLSVLFTTAFLKAPVRLRGTKEQLPRVTDEPFLARIAELAAKMNVSVPIVRPWPSVTGSQQALAFAGTIQAPQLVVTDGILRRLDPAERDAIVAHELAHIANGSLWSLAAVIPVSCTVTTIASAFLPQPIVWPLGLAFYVGLKRLVSRPYELDCDRRAARAIGYRETIGALAKIHAVHPIRSSGLVSLLVYATATHPSREIRLAALRDAAPETERPAIELSESRIRWQRRATLAAFVIWLVTISTTVAVSVGKLPAGFLPIPLWIVGLAPLVLIHLAQRKRLALNRKRLGKRVERIFTLVFVVIVAALVLPQLSNALIEPLHVPGPQLLQPATSLLLIVGSLGFIIWLAWTNRRRELRKAVAIALQVHDFRRILELARRSPRDVSRDHILRYNVALARAVCDDRPAAIAMLDGLWQDKPGFPLTGFALGQILLDTGQPEQALAVAEALVRKLPRDAGTHALAARVRRRLRQLDEAQSACDRVLALEPEDGPGYGIAAGLALDRGEPTRAQELITRALDYSPGDTHLLIIRAEVAIQTKPLDEARALVAEAIAAVRSNPMVLLKTDVTGLEQKLAAREMREASSQPVLAASDSAATG